MARAEADAAPGTVPGLVPGSMRVVTRAAHRAAALPWQPWSVLGPLLLVQWAAVAAFALAVRHNGWLFYQGGDEAAYWTTAWALGSGHLPVTPIGWGWSLLLAPVAAVTGPGFLHSVPALVVLQALLLQPIALVSLYAIGARLGGRLLGYVAVAFWIGAPFLVVLGTDPRYHERWVEQFLPQLLGLTGLGDFPSTVALLAAAALILRAIAQRGWPNTVLAGLVTGFGIGIKPANALFLVGAALAFLLARRIGQGLLFALALVPALLVLAVWKQRGLGGMPLFALATHALAAGAGVSLPRPPSLLGAALGTSYVHLDWSMIDKNLVDMREFFWSSRVYHVLPFVGLAAVLRRSRPAAGLLGGWFGAYFLVKGSSQYATIESGSFFRLLMPALPAYALLVAAIPLLVPDLGGRLVAAGTRLRGPALPRPRALLGTAALVLAVLPLLLFAAAPHLPAGQAVKFFQNGTYVPVTGGTPTAAVGADGAVRLSWRAAAATGIGTWQKVFRSSTDPVSCQSTGGTIDCSVSQSLQVLATTRDTTLTDTPGPGVWWYSVGTLANWRDDPAMGDVLQFAPAVRVEVR